MSHDSSGRVADATLRELGSGQRFFRRYTLIKILGHGGMGVVWLARDEELEREVALKFLPELIVHDRALLDELKRETRRSLELTHKNIIRIHDFVNDESSGCISMEYVDGDTLANLRAEKEQKVYEPHEIAKWMSQLCNALDYAHNEARIVHRDLKPANLMVNRSGDLKVSDFGIARSLGDSISRLTMEQGRSGTLVYMSPQQLEGERGTHLDDIYSLGATLYDLLTSKPPFYSGNIDRQIHERVPPSMSERRRDLNIEPASVPAIWEEVVAACLQKDPAKRPQSAAEVANRLRLAAPQTGWARTTLVTRSRTKLLAISVGTLLLIVAIAGWYFVKSKLYPKMAPPATNAPSQTAGIAAKSIAVLPFENLSEEKANAFFANGIRDEILTRLSKIADLKVISRTSTEQFASKPSNLQQIGKELGVAAILEGSVQKVGNKIRVNVQLIEAATDSHLWADTYDRELLDILQTESEVATEVASALRVTMSPQEKARVERLPTNNVEAYTLYLKARELETRFSGILPRFLEAQNLYEQAIKLDPNFALAHADLSLIHSWIYELFEQTEPHRIGARVESEEALRLQPDLGEAHLARAAYFLRIERDFEAALKSLKAARKLLPSDPGVAGISANILKRQGRWKEAIGVMEHAVSVDPRDVGALDRLGEGYLSLHQWAAAERVYKRATEIIKSPADSLFNAQIVWAIYSYWYLTSDLSPAEKILNDVPAGFDPGGNVTQDRYSLAMLKRDFARAESVVSACKLDTFDVWEGPKVTKSFLLGTIALAQGKFAKARPLLETELQFAQSQVLENPTSANRRAQLGLVFAYLGRKEEAIREGRKAVELSPESADAYDGPGMAANLAEIYGRVGERDQALALIERSLKTPSGLILRDLQNLWNWDPLRDDPRFQKIIAGPEPQVIYK